MSKCHRDSYQEPSLANLSCFPDPAWTVCLSSSLSMDCAEWDQPSGCGKEGTAPPLRLGRLPAESCRLNTPLTL